MADRREAGRLAPRPAGPSPDSPETRKRPTEADGARRDARYLESWRDGDWDAGLELMRSYYRYFLSLCHAYGVRGKDEQTDLFHDVVMRLHQVLPSLTLERSFGGYLRKVLLTALRARGSRRQEPLPEDIATREKSPTSGLEREEILAAIHDCSDRLDGREKTLFDQRHFQDRKLADIAEEQRLTLDHLYVLYHRVRKKMTRCLEGKGVRL